MGHLAHDLADIALTDADGTSVLVGSAWQGRPAVLVFIRHFG
jgi:hypothetical protein